MLLDLRKRLPQGAGARILQWEDLTAVSRPKRKNPRRVGSEDPEANHQRYRCNLDVM